MLLQMLGKKSNDGSERIALMEAGYENGGQQTFGRAFGSAGEKHDGGGHMTIQEASRRYKIPVKILREYESWGLCGAVKKVMGAWAV